MNKESLSHTHTCTHTHRNVIQPWEKRKPCHLQHRWSLGFPGSTGGTESTFQCRRRKRHGFNPWVRRSPGGGHGNPLQYPCLEHPMDRGAATNTDKLYSFLSALITWRRQIESAPPDTAQITVSPFSIRLFSEMVFLTLSSSIFISSCCQGS